MYVCENHPLGTFQLPNIAPGPAGSASVLVTMRVGEDGVLQVTAADQLSGESQCRRLRRQLPPPLCCCRCGDSHQNEDCMNSL